MPYSYKKDVPASVLRRERALTLNTNYSRMKAARPIPSMSESDKERFWNQTRNDGECLLWTGPNNKTGYGFFMMKPYKSPLKANRVAYFAAFGICPPELEVCHRCDRPSCVNPSHLFLGTHKANIQDGIRKGRINFAAMGSITSEKKTEAARKNAKKPRKK